MTFLERILSEKACEIARTKTVCSEQEMRRLAAARTTPFRGFEAALREPGIQIVAEIKRASPSKGDLQLDLDPAALAKAYEDGGAAALSVLTDPAFFKGSINDLRAARAAVSIPVLQKDFIIDPYQIDEACAAGADAVLLIVRTLDYGALHNLYAHARDLGLDVLTEVFDAADADRAHAVGATLIGINNRDLTTFGTDLSNAVMIARHLPAATLSVALSGVTSTDDVADLTHSGLSKFLIGEALVRSVDPVTLLRTMRKCEVHHD